MMRFWTQVCCWFVCSHGAIFSFPESLHAQDLALTNASVIRICPLPGEKESPVVTAMAIAADGSEIVVAGDDHSIRLLHPLDNRDGAVQLGHQDWVKCLAFSPGGRFLASCGNDGELIVWERVLEGKSLRLLTRQRVEHAIFGLAFASENELYAVGFSDAVYRLVVATGAWRIDHRCDCHDLRAIDISKDGRWMAYGGRDGIIRLHPLVDSEHLLTGGTFPPEPGRGPRLSPHLHYDRILSIRFSDDGKSLFSCGEDRRIVQWEPSSNRVIASMDVQAGKLMAACPLDATLVAVSGTDNTIRIVDIQRGESIAKLVGHDGTVAVLQKTSTHLISSGFDTTIRTWPLEQTTSRTDREGRFVHPISAQFEDSSSQEPIR
jgi:WD40 repeat protein